MTSGALYNVMVIMNLLNLSIVNERKYDCRTSNALLWSNIFGWGSLTYDSRVPDYADDVVTNAEPAAAR